MVCLFRQTPYINCYQKYSFKWPVKKHVTSEFAYAYFVYVKAHIYSKISQLSYVFYTYIYIYIPPMWLTHLRMELSHTFHWNYCCYQANCCYQTKIPLSRSCLIFYLYQHWATHFCPYKMFSFVCTSIHFEATMHSPFARLMCGCTEIGSHKDFLFFVEIQLAILLRSISLALMYIWAKEKP